MHKATHHFDLINWWLDADPVEVTAYADLEVYGKKGPFRSHALPSLPAQVKMPFLLRHDKERSG